MTDICSALQRKKKIVDKTQQLIANCPISLTTLYNYLKADIIMKIIENVTSLTTPHVCLLVGWSVYLLKRDERHHAPIGALDVKCTN